MFEYDVGKYRRLDAASFNLWVKDVLVPGLTGQPVPTSNVLGSRVDALDGGSLLSGDTLVERVSALEKAKVDLTTLEAEVVRLERRVSTLEGSNSGNSGGGTGGNSGPQGPSPQPTPSTSVPSSGPFIPPPPPTPGAYQGVAPPVANTGAPAPGVTRQVGSINGNPRPPPSGGFVTKGTREYPATNYRLSPFPVSPGPPGTLPALPVRLPDNWPDVPSDPTLGFGDINKPLGSTDNPMAYDSASPRPQPNSASEQRQYRIQPGTPFKPVSFTNQRYGLTWIRGDRGKLEMPWNSSASTLDWSDAHLGTSINDAWPERVKFLFEKGWIAGF